MAAEFHGIIYDPEKRKLNLKDKLKDVSNWYQIGEWAEDGICYINCNMFNYNIIYYKLSGLGLKIKRLGKIYNSETNEFEEDIYHSIIWSGDPPINHQCNIL